MGRQIPYLKPVQYRVEAAARGVVSPLMTCAREKRILSTPDRTYHVEQYVRKIRDIFSDKEYQWVFAVYRDFGGNDYRLRPFTVGV